MKRVMALSLTLLLGALAAQAQQSTTTTTATTTRRRTTASRTDPAVVNQLNEMKQAIDAQQQQIRQLSQQIQSRDQQLQQLQQKLDQSQTAASQAESKNHLKHPYSPYIPTFFGSAGANPSVLPAHLLAHDPNINNVPYNSKPVGIGPFRVVVWKRGDSITLEANPYYFRGEPKIKHITYKLIPSRDTLLTLMQTGEVELWPEVPPSYIVQTKNITSLDTMVRPGIYYAHLDFNVTRPLVSDVRVREAIRYALDRRQIVSKISHGYAVLQDSIVPPSLPFAPKGIPFIEQDVAKAKALLDQAGWKTGAGGIRVRNGQRLSLYFPYYTGVSTADDTVEMIREELRAVGIDIQTRKFAPAMFFAPYQNGGIVYGSKWDMTMFSWQGLPVADISNTMACDQMPPAGQNVLRYCNKQLDAMMNQVKLTYDEEKQKALLAQEVRIIIADVPTIVLDVLDTGFTYNKNLTGYDPGAFTPFDQMDKVDI